MKTSLRRTFLSLLKGWVVSFLGWGTLGAAISGHLVLNSGVPWLEAAEASIHQWTPWAIVTPLVFLLVRHLPIERERWWLAVPVHLLCGALTLAVVDRASFEGPGPRQPHDHRHGKEPGFIGERERPPRPGDGPGRGPRERGPGRFGPGAREGGPPPREGGAPPPEGKRKGPPFGFGLFIILATRLPIYLAVLSAAHALHFFRRAREREVSALGLEASLAKARLEALKMQLQPHFLFNSLNALAELVHSKPAAAEEMIVALSDLLRRTLSASSEQEVPLARELEFIDHYLAIEQIRFGDRLQVEREIEPAALSALVPTLLLQPLVENAVRHGLEPRGAAGLLAIRAWREGERLRLFIGDNGVGLPGGRVPAEGIGLSNTRARLRELYGDAATFTIGSEAGVRVEISLPFRTA